MSPDQDRIAVPTNGKHPHLLPEPASPGSGELPPPSPPAPSPSATFSPTQLAVGFGIMAAIVALVAGSLRRRSRSGRRGPFGRG